MDKNPDNTDSLAMSIRLNFPDYTIAKVREQGTYGQVWILSLATKNLHSPAIAIKTIQLEDEIESEELLNTFEREMALSLAIPGHFNVLPIFGFVSPKLFYIRADGKPVWVPALKMKAMQGSLQEWIDQIETIPYADRLIACIQILSGLKHLYKNGVQGHGDIKPSNFLFTDLSSRFKNINSGFSWPSDVHPYHVVVADFGYADYWIDRGQYGKVLREFKAPERFNNEFHTEKSDIFSIGIMLAMLLQGRHPARNFKKATKSDGNWRACCEKGDWELSDDLSENIRRLILLCLESESYKRPDSARIICGLSAELKNFHVHGVAEYIELASQIYDDKSTRLSWALPQVSSLSDVEKEKMINEIQTRLEEVENELDSIASCRRWYELAQALINVSEREFDKELRFKATARYCILEILSRQSVDSLEIAHFSHFPESFSVVEAMYSLVGELNSIALFDYEQENSNGRLSGLVLAGLAWSKASDLRFEDQLLEYHYSKIRFYVDECIRHLPEDQHATRMWERWQEWARILKE